MSNNTRAILLMSLSVGILASLDGVVKIINTLGIHPLEIVFLRNVFGLIALTPFFMRIGFRELRTQRLKMHISRGCIHSCSMMSWFVAITIVPLADATALSFSVPLFTSIGAILFMSEPSRFGRWLSIAIGFVGMLLILRPGFIDISYGNWLVVGGSIFITTSKLMTKSLTRTESSSTIVAYMSLTLTVVSFVPAVLVWTTPNLEVLLWCALMGAMGSIAHVVQAQSFRLGDVTLIEPAGFLRLVWAAAIGFIIFGEVPDIWSWIGAGVIMVAVVMLLRFERNPKSEELNTPPVI